MTPDPLPVALPELPTVAWRWPSGRLAHFRIDPISEPKLAPLCVALVRKSDAEAALRAQAEEVERLRAMLEQVRDEWYRFTPYSHLKSRIDAHLASKQELT